MSDRLTENLTDIRSGQFFDLAQLEHFTLQRRQSLETPTDRFLRFSSAQTAIRWDRRLKPVSAAIELGFEHLVDWIVLPFTNLGPPTFLNLVVQDTEQPGAHLRTPFESVERFDERDQNLLREIFRVLFSKAHPSGGPIKLSGVLLDDRPQRFGITLTEAIEERRVNVAHTSSYRYCGLRRSPAVMTARVNALTPQGQSTRRG